MRRYPLAAVALLAFACAKQEQAPAADSPAAAMAPAAFSLADAAGTWTYIAKSATGDTTLVTAEITGTADPASWTILLPGRKAMPMTVTVSGDSLMTASGPYESVLRKGVQVTTDGALHMVDGKLVGSTTAHYSVKTADSVRHLVVEATRKMLGRCAVGGGRQTLADRRNSCG
jgi:hypothetical protein